MLDFDDLTPGILGRGCRRCLTYNQIYLPRAIQKKYVMVDKQSDHVFLLVIFDGVNGYNKIETWWSHMNTIIFGVDQSNLMQIASTM